MVTKGPFSDADGNRVWIDNTRLILEYVKDPQKGGKATRTIGNVRGGIWTKEVVGEWQMRTQGDFFVSRLPLTHYKGLGYNIIRFVFRERKDGPVVRSGFVHPFLLLHNPMRQFGKAGHDKQHILTLDDVAPSPEQAKERAKALKDRLEAFEAAERAKSQPEPETPANKPDEPQGSLF